MKAIGNSGLLKLVAAWAGSTAFAPVVGYVYDASAKTVVMKDTTTYVSGDSIKVVNCHVTDSAGVTLHKVITVTGTPGAITIDVSTLNPVNGFAIRATVVTTQGMAADVAAYRVGATAPAAGNLSGGNIA